MPPPNFASLSLPSSTVDRVTLAKMMLEQRGLLALPAKLRPAPGTPITNGLVVELALRALENAMLR